MKDKQNTNASEHPLDLGVICYRCGWCGAPTTMDGTPIDIDEANKMDVDWDKAEQVNGIGCCNAAEEDQQERQATEEMMRDAGLI
jgi:hypothetical protein